MSRRSSLLILAAIVAAAVSVPVVSQPAATAPAVVPPPAKPVGRYALVRASAVENNAVTVWILDTSTGQLYVTKAAEAPSERACGCQGAL
jgi:hypothetical protein